MDNTLRQLIAVYGRNLKETVYRDSPAGMLDYRLITTDLFEWETKAPVERQRLLHKNTVAVEDFSMLTRLLPELSGLDYKKRDKMSVPPLMKDDPSASRADRAFSAFTRYWWT